MIKNCTVSKANNFDYIRNIYKVKVVKTIKLNYKKIDLILEWNSTIWKQILTEIYLLKQRECEYIERKSRKTINCSEKMNNQMNVRVGDAVFFEGMYYYCALAQPMNVIPSAQAALGPPAFRQAHSTQTRLVKNQVPKHLTWSSTNFVDPMATNFIGK